MKKIYPSILSADFSKLGEEVKTLELAGADGVHIDVMDGVFVPNITFGMPIVRDIRKYTKLPFDVHLMISDPKRYINDFILAGADIITFHIEATNEPIELINMIKQGGKMAGISIKPNTPLPSIDILKSIDVVLIMSVEPGFGGQKYIVDVNEKICELSQIRDENNLKLMIEVDGGITLDNIDMASKCGVDIFVAGSCVFNADDRASAIRELKNTIN